MYRAHLSLLGSQRNKALPRRNEGQRLTELGTHLHLREHYTKTRTGTHDSRPRPLSWVRRYFETLLPFDIAVNFSSGEGAGGGPLAFFSGMIRPSGGPDEQHEFRIVKYQDNLEQAIAAAGQGYTHALYDSPTRRGISGSKSEPNLRGGEKIFRDEQFRSAAHRCKTGTYRFQEQRTVANLGTYSGFVLRALNHLERLE